MAEHNEVVDGSQDALLETLNLLLKASNRTTDKTEFLRLKAKREEVMHKLDRIELAQINEAVPPAKVLEAMTKLRKLTDSLVQERDRIKQATEKLQKADEYLALANDVLKLVGSVLAFV